MTRLFTVVACCCSIFLMSCSLNASSETVSQSPSHLDGRSLYQEYCANCHRPINRTTKSHTNASRLRSAIKLFPAMNKLDYLSAEQIDAIASALATIKLEQVSKNY